LVNNEAAEFLDVDEDIVPFRVVRWETARVWARTHLFPALSLKRLSEHVN
jgi:hypothetical protein